MKYELRIGWRYLYGGKRDPLMLICAGGSLLVTLAGVLWVLTSSGTSPYGVLTLVLGMISTAVFGLLSAFTVFTSVSVLGVALGVAALTIVLAVTTGFQQQFRDKVLGVNAHVIVLKSQATFAEYRDVMKTAQRIDPDVLAVQPFIFAEMLVTTGKGQSSGVAIKGVDPKLIFWEGKAFKQPIPVTKFCSNKMKRKQLIECLAPNRRVTVEAVGVQPKPPAKKPEAKPEAKPESKPEAKPKP